MSLPTDSFDLDGDESRQILEQRLALEVRQREKYREQAEERLEEIKILTSELLKLRRSSAKTDKIRRSSERKVRQVKDEMASLKRRLNAIESSFFWRSSYPLRSVFHWMKRNIRGRGAK